MTTRKLTLCVFAAIAALVTACSNDELTGNETPQEGIVIKATAGTPEGSADTRLTHTPGTGKMNIVWAANDEFTACTSDGDRTNYKIESTDAGKSSASFVGTWNSAPSAGTVRALYPAIGNDVKSTTVTLTLDGQDGTYDGENGLKKFNYMTATTNYSGTGDLSFGKFDHKVAIVKLVLNFPDIATGSAVNIGLRAKDLNKSIILNLEDGTSSGKYAGYITTGTNAIAIADNQLTAYLCVFPSDGELTDAKAIATVGSENYKAELPDLKLEAGHMYTANVTMKKSIIGYYYYSDGSCQKTYDTGKSCVGVVFWESEDGKQAKIADLTDSEKKMWADGFLTTKEWGFSNKADGAAATKEVISDQIKNEDFEYYYPIFYWLYNTKNGGDVDGRWYIPAIDELEQLLNIAIVNDVFRNSLATAGTALRIAGDKPAFYWTCTEGRPGGTGKLAINVAQIQGTISNTVNIQFTLKDGSTCVRAISAITINN